MAVGWCNGWSGRTVGLSSRLRLATKAELRSPTWRLSSRFSPAERMDCVNGMDWVASRCVGSRWVRLGQDTPLVFSKGRRADCMDEGRGGNR